jgi:serine/threonine protein kinase
VFTYHGNTQRLFLFIIIITFFFTFFSFFFFACISFILLELVTQGELYTLIHNSSVHLSWKFIQRAASELAIGMKFMHDQHIAHLDFKSPNIMISTIDVLSGQPIVKIADFGLSKKVTTFITGMLFE